MPGQKFLEQIADYYTDPARLGNLADITFVFPNKRSAMFLKRYIQQRVVGGNVLMPRFSTFSRLASRIVRVAEASHFEKLFLLYSAYRQVLGEQTPDRREQAKDFDRFIFWGDMILGDFDEIDKSLADPAKLYSNLEALHSITSDYLTDEQKDIIRRIWGDTNLTGHIERFWFHTSPGEDASPLTRKFISLWQILARIYDVFRDKLRAAHLTTSGMQMREAMKIIKDTSLADLARRRYVFVGLAELSNAEIAIMDRLKLAGAADFFWDISSPLFNDSDGRANADNRALRAIAALAKQYPMPSDFTLSLPEKPGNIRIIGVASGVAQAKCVGNIIRRIKNDEDFISSGGINTAIVLPDPGKLMPLMLSLPDNLPAVNITMGLPYSSTTFATLFRAIIAMQRRSRRRRGGVRTYFFQDVLEVLVHPHLQLLTPDKANSVRQYIYDRRLFNIDAEKLSKEFDELAFIFAPIMNRDSLDDTYEYITGLLRGMRKALERHSGFKSSFELDILSYFDREIAELKRLIDKYGIEMQETTFLSMFERILQSKTINVEGTPLCGLQVMGVLETRSLDFDNIIFLSMNERTFPRRDYVRTMIPNNLRRGYGLPPIEQSESFYAYHFFRAIGRASNVTLLYDSRPPGKSSGEMSRYLSQLLYVRNGYNVSHHIIDIKGRRPSARSISVSKTPEVLRQLDRFKTPGGPKISATALKTYMKCPLCFYLRFVNGLQDDDDPVDYLDAGKLGDIFHKTAKRLFDQYKGSVMSPAIIDKMLHDGRMEKILIEELADYTGLDPKRTVLEDLSYEAILIKSQIEIQLRSMLDAEARLYCNGESYVYLEGEKDVVDKQWEIYPGLKVNFRMQIDRIDRIAPDTLRFIDYKTGSDKAAVGETIENLFCGKHERDAVFQLLVYSEAYHDLVDPNVKILPVLHIIKEIVKTGIISPITYNKRPLEPFPAVTDEFRPLLNELFSKIFDDTTPFGQCDDAAKCKYCPFLSMCGRNLPDENF